MWRTPEMGVDDVPERVTRHVLVASEITFEIRGITDEHVIGIELIGFSAESADRLQPEHELCFCLSMAAFHLLITGTAIGKPINFLENGVLDFGECMPWCGSCGDLEEPGYLPRVLTRGYICCDPLVEYQSSIEA